MGRTNPMVGSGRDRNDEHVPRRRYGREVALHSAGIGSRFADVNQVDEEVFASASATNSINRAIADLLGSYGRPATDSEGDS